MFCFDLFRLGHRKERVPHGAIRSSRTTQSMVLAKPLIHIGQFFPHLCVDPASQSVKIAVETASNSFKSHSQSLTFVYFSELFAAFSVSLSLLTSQVIHVRQRRRQLRDRVEAALARAGKSMSTALRTGCSASLQRIVTLKAHT